MSSQNHSGCLLDSKMNIIIWASSTALKMNLVSSNRMEEFTMNEKTDREISETGEDNQMTAEQVLEAIGNMENEERWILIEKMYDQFYNPDKLTKDKSNDIKLEVAYLNHKILEIEKDLEKFKQK